MQINFTPENDAEVEWLRSRARNRNGLPVLTNCRTILTEGAKRWAEEA